MGKLYFFLSALLIAVGSLYAVEPSGYEWWIDNDVSGVRSGAFTAGKLDLKIDTSDLPRGAHYFNCRLNTEEGAWGAVYRRMFYAIGKDNGAIGYEYWFDNDHDNKETGSLAGGKKTFAVNVSTLTPGMHYFNCRLNSSETEWGAVYRKMIYAAGTSQDVSGYEYWFDDDYEAKKSGDISSGGKTFAVNAANLSPGVHYFNCRLCSTDGTWGAVYRKMVFTTPTGIDASAFEYWIDNNYDSKTEGDIAEGSNTHTVGLSGLRRGLHRFNYRIRTGAGVWGSVYSNYFYIDPNSSFSKTFEYWLDDDYAGRQTMTSAINNVSFKMDLSGFDKAAAKPHFFNLRVYDEGYPESSTFYRKLIVPFKGVKAPIIGYRQFLNGSELGYVDVERQFVESYMFDVELPDNVRPTVKNHRPSFDGDKVFIAGADSIDYTIQIRTELGWAPPQNWMLGVSNDFSTTAVAMEINSRHTFTKPSDLEFAAMKFTASGDSLYFRSDVPVAIDLYKGGEKVAALTPAQVKVMGMLRLEAGEYFGILHSVEDAEAKNFTLHLMDTPNRVPTPTIMYADRTVTISCSRTDTQVRYTLDGNDPDMESELYSEPFQLNRNAAIKAKAWVPDSDIDPSDVAMHEVDSFKAEAPVAEFNLAERLLTLKTETKDASIFYTNEYDPADSLGGVWTDYKDPIQIRKNCTVYSRAAFDGYKDSDITVTEITALPDSVPLPRIEFANGIVTISCAEKDAEIHYTLDGNRPTAASDRYDGAFPLRRNAIVKAMAFVPGLDIDSSRVATRVIDSYKVATPKGSFDVKTRLLTLTCDTVGASISYRFDKEGEWSAYSDTERIRMRKNGMVYAKAAFEGYNDSDIAEIMVSELPNEVAPPVITCDANAVVAITCGTEDAVIRYTFDEEQPGMESPVYEDKFTITRNTRVNAFAYVPDLDIAASAISSALFDIFTVADPRWDFNPESKELTIACDTEDTRIFYTSDPEGEWTLYTAPIQIRKNCTLYAKAVRDGYNDSNTVTITVNSLADSVPVPEIAFADGMVAITCANPDARIRYALDDAPLTMESTLYEGAFELLRNATVRAFAYIPGLDIEPSDPVTFVVDSYKVADPIGSFDATKRELTITCGTTGAKIFYSFDRDSSWIEYTGPISITRNCTVYAKAVRDGYNDSDISEIAVTALADSVAAPTIDFTDGMVTITCATADAEIHYTVDDADLTAESPLYTAPFRLDRNATVRTFALIPGLDIEPSGVTMKVVDSYKALAPTGSFNSDARELTLTCATDGARILYSFNPEGEWIEYTGPISITRNCTVYAKAVRDGWNDSEISEIAVTALADSVAAPAIDFADGIVTITCASEGAEIHYTIDDPELTAESPLYTAPFRLDRNATVRAFALIPGLDIEPSGVTMKVVDSYKVATPTGSFDSEARRLTIHCDTEGAAIFHSLDEEEWQLYLAPIAVEGNRIVYAKATRDGYNDSEIAEIVVSDMKCAGVSFSYNGRYLHIETEETGASILYTSDGSDPTDGTAYDDDIDVKGLGRIRAIAVKEGWLNSDPGEFHVDRYADEVHAETSAEGLLASAFDWDDTDIANNVDTYSVEGRLNDSDYAFLRSMRSLRHLDIGKVADAHIPEYAFRDSRLISISLPEDLTECGDSILSATPNLSSVIWNSSTMNVGEGVTQGLVNPNVLLYVPEETSVSSPEGLNIVRNDHAESLILRYGYPYYAARNFRAGIVSLTHEFLQTTKVDTCRGWETLVLPFSPTSVTHEVNGPAVPFASWNGDIDGDKPFWLYKAIPTGWEAATSIEACVPYIISMPNNSDYVREFNLGGKVTFSAFDADLGPDSSFGASEDWMEGTRFEGTFMPVEETGVLSLNVGSTEEDLEPGSTFVAWGTTVPFGAYVSGASGRRAMPVFGGSNGVDVPLIVDTGLLVETPAPGTLRISSGRERKVAVTTATGVTLRTLHLRPGDTVTLEGLTRDLYIVGGRKVMVR